MHVTIQLRDSIETIAKVDEPLIKTLVDKKGGQLIASKVVQSFKLPCSEQLHRSSKTQISQSDRQINCTVLSLDSS